MYKRLFWALLVLAILAAGALAMIWVRDRGQRGPSDASLTPVSIRLPIPVADTAFAPYYLAVDKGIFEKHGLTVTLEPGTPELNPVKMVTQGTDEFGVLGGPELLLSARAKGAPLKGIFLLHKDSDFVVLLTLADSGITTLDQLQGKRVGFFYGHISTDVLRMLFAKQDVTVEEVDVGFDYGPLLTRQVAAEWAFRTTAGISLPARDVEINVISPADYGLVTQGHVVVTSEDVIADDPGMVERFVAAVKEATSYSLEHTEEAIASTIRRDPNFQSEVGEQQLQVYNPAILRTEPLGSFTEADMERTKEQMSAAGLLDAEFPVKDSYTNRFLR